MKLPQVSLKNFKLPFKALNFACVMAVVFTLVLLVVQFQVSSTYEVIAKRIGVFDRQSKVVNTVYLDYEEQAAIMRSSNFLITEKGKDYVAYPAKVIYVEPINTKSVVSER